MSRTFSVSFPGSKHSALSLSEGSNLSEHLTIENSPVLFGCRTGICGTCLVKVKHGGALPPPGEEEREVLDVLAEDEPGARLCCQLDLRDDVEVEVLPGS